MRGWRFGFPLAVFAIAAAGCAHDRLRLTPIRGGAPPGGETFVVARPGGLEVDFVTVLASATGLRVAAYQVADRKIEIRLRSRQTRTRCAVEERVHFRLVGLDPGEWRVVVLDDGERRGEARVRIEGAAIAEAGGRRRLRGHGC